MILPAPGKSAWRRHPIGRRWRIDRTMPERSASANRALSRMDGIDRPQHSLPDVERSERRVEELRTRTYQPIVRHAFLHRWSRCRMEKTDDPATSRLTARRRRPRSPHEASLSTSAFRCGARLVGDGAIRGALNATFAGREPVAQNRLQRRCGFEQKLRPDCDAFEWVALIRPGRRRVASRQQKFEDQPKIFHRIALRKRLPVPRAGG